MKDYTLSEIKAHCKARIVKYQNPCKGCEMEVVCKSTLPVGWDIEPRDMIELPCKMSVITRGDGEIYQSWQVLYRRADDEGECVAIAWFANEPEADAFLAELKGENNGN